MRYFGEIQERIAYGREHMPADLLVIEEVMLAEYKETEEFLPTRSHSLGRACEAFASIYHADGTEYSMRRVGSFVFKHTLPFQGIMHRHDFIEILYVIDGSFDQVLMGEQLHFEKGEFVITDQNCEHADILLPVEAAVLFIQISVEYMRQLLHNYNRDDMLERFLFRALRQHKKEQRFLELRREQRDMSEDEERDLLHLLEEIYVESYRELADQGEVMNGLLHRLLNLLCTRYTPILHSNDQEAKETLVLYELERYVLKNYATVTSLELEQVFHYHRNYYNLLLKKHYGKTFKEYLLDVRLEKAHDLLQKEQHTSVKKIAQSVGYENTSHFYHLYKEKYGHGPRDE